MVVKHTKNQRRNKRNTRKKRRIRKNLYGSGSGASTMRINLNDNEAAIMLITLKNILNKDPNLKFDYNLLNQNTIQLIVYLNDKPGNRALLDDLLLISLNINGNRPEPDKRENIVQYLKSAVDKIENPEKRDLPF